MDRIISVFWTAAGTVRHWPPPIACVNNLPRNLWECSYALIRVSSFSLSMSSFVSEPCSTAVVNEQFATGHVQICVPLAVATSIYPIMPRLYSIAFLVAVCVLVDWRSLVGGVGTEVQDLGCLGVGVVCSLSIASSFVLCSNSVDFFGGPGLDASPICSPEYWWVVAVRRLDHPMTIWALA